MPFQKGHKPTHGFQKGCISTMKGRHHSEESKRKIRLANKGKHYSPKTEFKKGNRIRYKDGIHRQSGGYKGILKKDHPFTTYWGYVFEHRLVVEKQIGRYLLPEEKCHHLGKKDDNRPHMLMAFVNESAHQRFHHNPDNVKPEEIIFDGRNSNRYSYD